jgi:hypothetical protein
LLTVLLTDGAFTGLIRTLREGYADDIRIVGLSVDVATPHQAILDAFYVMPSHDDASYMNQLIGILLAEQVQIIFPIISEGLESLLQEESRIYEETGARIISSPLTVLTIANDKGLLYRFLQGQPDEKLSSLIPVFYEAITKESLLTSIDLIRSSGQTPCIKRRRGEDAEGFWVIDDTANYAENLFYRQPKRLLSGKMLTDMLSEMKSSDPIPPYLVSEYLPGEEWDCDVLCMNGELLSVTTRINLAMNGGLTSVAEVRYHPFLASSCRKIVAVLHLSYVACISFRADAAGRMYLLEINPRMMGNIYVSALAGNNYAKMSIDLLEGRDICPVHPKDGVKTALYYDQLQIMPPSPIRHFDGGVAGKQEDNGGLYV